MGEVREHIFTMMKKSGVLASRRQYIFWDEPAAIFLTCYDYSDAMISVAYLGGGVIGPWCPFGKKNFFFTIGKNRKTWFGPPFV